MPELALQHALAFVRLPPRLRIKQSAGEPLGRAESAYLWGPSQAQKSLLQTACPSGYHADSALANGGMYT